MPHPLDEQYWRKKEHWRWWGYACPDDPRIVVNKRPRWAGYTLNFAHRKAILVLAGLLLFTMLPILAAIVLLPGPGGLPYVFAVTALTVSLMILYCYRAANPKSWVDADGVLRDRDA